MGGDHGERHGPMGGYGGRDGPPMRGDYGDRHGPMGGYGGRDGQRTDRDNDGYRRPSGGHHDGPPPKGHSAGDSDDKMDPKYGKCIACCIMLYLHI